jgi:hypothetical protein
MKLLFALDRTSKAISVPGISPKRISVEEDHARTSLIGFEVCKDFVPQV